MSAATTDPLTGLLDRAAFDSEVARLAEVGEPFALLYLDLDRFKAVNGLGNWEKGDEVLRQTGLAILSVIRDGTRVFRPGGDEFAVLVPGGTAPAVLELGERIRRAVATIEVPESDDPAFPAPVRLGVQVGVACYPTDGRTADELVGAADRSIFQAIRTGAPAIRSTTLR